MRIFLGILLGLVALFLLWLFWPSRLNPAYWDEPDAPALTGILEPRGELVTARRIAEGEIAFSEDLALGENGIVYTGQPDGRLVRIFTDETPVRVETVARITDKPVLGLQWLDENRLAVAASDGLYGVDIRNGEVELFSSGPTDRPFGFANDLDIGPDGTIYFTDSSWRWPNAEDEPSFQLDMAENRPYGALYAFHPETGELTLLIDGLYYANGVAMAADGQSVFFLETFRYRLNRYWTSGPRAGEREIVADNLPGIPDGLMGDRQGHLYIAMDTQRVPLLRFLHRNPFWTRMLTKLPEWVWLRAGTPQAFILKISEDGTFLDSWHDPDGEMGFIANVVPAEDGSLWIGHLDRPFISHFTPDAP
tara:strand:- start:333 stop:1424 length:1092 start_codon:yes stop_codon:yes gene_type:complete